MSCAANVIAALLAGLVVLAACSPSAPTAPSTGGTTRANPVESVTVPRGTEITFWHVFTGEQAPLIERLVAEFNATNEHGITVKSEFAGNYTQAYQKTLAALQAQSPPDIAIAYESMANDYYKGERLVIWDDYVNSTKYGLTKDQLADFIPAYIEVSRFPEYNGQMLTFPFVRSTHVMYTNLDVMKQLGFSKPAETWDEFLVQSLAAAATGIAGMAFAPDA
jgi:ABC-type glycerol-3-phosphate transport system substrate-binding protein